MAPDVRPGRPTAGVIVKGVLAVSIAGFLGFCTLFVVWFNFSGPIFADEAAPPPAGTGAFDFVFAGVVIAVTLAITGVAARLLVPKPRRWVPVAAYFLAALYLLVGFAITA